MMKQTILAAVVAALTLSGCSAARSARSAQTASRQWQSRSEAVVRQADSLRSIRRSRAEHDRRQTVTNIVTREGIPAQQTRLEIPLEALARLPDGAGYAGREGRSSVEVRRSGPKVVVTGRCDSLARLCEVYRRELSDARTVVDSMRRQTDRRLRDSLRADGSDEVSLARAEKADRRRYAGWYLWLTLGIAVGAVMNKTGFWGKILTFLKKLLS